MFGGFHYKLLSKILYVFKYIWTFCCISNINERKSHQRTLTPMNKETSLEQVQTIDLHFQLHFSLGWWPQRLLLTN